MLNDAHCHLHQLQHDNNSDALIQLQQSYGVGKLVVNGTCESDWQEVITMAQQFPLAVIPALGLHPWEVNKRGSNWFQTLETLVTTHVTAIGEIGLDKWIPDHDLKAQRECFEMQLALATRYNLPVSIHCLKAWGTLIEVLTSTELPERGIHIHAFGGSKESLMQLLELPCYFSFNGYFLHNRKRATLELYKSIPSNRILIESDAPSMRPPERYILYNQVKEHHPANITASLEPFAKIRNEDPIELQRKLNQNFAQYFENLNFIS